MANDPAALAKFVAYWNRLATFDGQAAALERICDPDRPAPGTKPELHSRSWFAGSILDAISAARDHQNNGRIDAAMAEAVYIGVYAAGGGFLRWRTFRTKQSERRRKGTQANQDNAAPRQDALRADVAALRQQWPHAPMRTIARQLLGKYPPGSRNPDRTTAAAIDALAKRIARLD